MAYADYEFYSKTFYGDVLTEQNADKWLSRASDEVDIITFQRLINGFPTDEKHISKVRKAVCAVAEALYFVDEHRQAVSAAKDAQGKYRGSVTSISSGRESISYSQTANATVYAKAAADSAELTALLRDVATKYLANVPDLYGINLLYAGVG